MNYIHRESLKNHIDGLYDDIDGLKETINEIEAENKRLRDALEKIVKDEGRVCNNFELCKCVSCQSSYHSWEIAKQALTKSGEALKEEKW